MEPRDRQSRCVWDDAALREDQANQNGNRHPCNRVPDNDSVSKSAVGQQPAVLHQRAAMQAFCRHGRLPEVPRAGGSQIVAASVSSELSIECRVDGQQVRAYRLAFDEQSRFTTTT